MQRNNFSTGEQKGKKSSFSVPLKNYSFRIFSLSSFSLLLHYPLELRHPCLIRHFRYRISSKKRVLWLTYEFDNEGDFAIYYDFLEEPYDTYPCRGKEWVWGTGWLPEEYRDWNERTPCLIMDELTNNIIEDSCFCNLIFDNLMMASVGFINTEDRSFEITPKRIKRTSDTVLTPEMKVIVTTDIHTTDPFYNGAKEIKEAYMRLYGFDYKKACCCIDDFEFKKLD